MYVLYGYATCSTLSIAA